MRVPTYKEINTAAWLKAGQHKIESVAFPHFTLILIPKVANR